MAPVTKLIRSIPPLFSFLNAHNLAGIGYYLSPEFRFHNSMGVLNADEFRDYLERLLKVHPGLHWEKDSRLTVNGTACEVYLRVQVGSKIIARQIWRMEKEQIRAMWHFNGGSEWGFAHDLCVSQGNPFLMAWSPIHHSNPILN